MSRAASVIWTILERLYHGDDTSILPRLGVSQKKLIVTSNYAARAFGIKKCHNTADVKCSGSRSVK